jgi:hypothetical protein
VSFVVLLILCLLTRSSPACAHFVALLCEHVNWQTSSIHNQKESPAPSDFQCFLCAPLVGRDCAWISDEKYHEAQKVFFLEFTQAKAKHVRTPFPVGVD